MDGRLKVDAWQCNVDAGGNAKCRHLRAVELTSSRAAEAAGRGAEGSCRSVEAGKFLFLLVWVVLGRLHVSRFHGFCMSISMNNIWAFQVDTLARVSRAFGKHRLTKRWQGLTRHILEERKRDIRTKDLRVNNVAGFQLKKLKQNIQGSRMLKPARNTEVKKRK